MSDRPDQRPDRDEGRRTVRGTAEPPPRGRRRRRTGPIVLWVALLVTVIAFAWWAIFLGDAGDPLDDSETQDVGAPASVVLTAP